MKPFSMNVIAFGIGLIAGFVVNSGIISISGSIIPPPTGVDFTTEQGLIKSMNLMQPKHFIMPFLAHAFGVLVGAFLVARIADNHRMTLGMSIGIFFLIGGVIAAYMLPSPLWFNVLDLLFAYLPMAYFGVKIGDRD